VSQLATTSVVRKDFDFGVEIIVLPLVRENQKKKEKVSHTEYPVSPGVMSQSVNVAAARARHFRVQRFEIFASFAVAPKKWYYHTIAAQHRVTLRQQTYSYLITLPILMTGLR